MTQQVPKRAVDLVGKMEIARILLRDIGTTLIEAEATIGTTEEDMCSANKKLVDFFVDSGMSQEMMTLVLLVGLSTRLENAIRAIKKHFGG